MLTGAPKITSDLSIRDMTVIAGEEFTITVPYVSNPTPRPTWTINGQEVISDSRIEFKTSANSTVFHNKCAKRATDSGSYTIQLVNNMGSDSASCRVLVVGEFLLYFLGNQSWNLLWYYLISFQDDRSLFENGSRLLPLVLLMIMPHSETAISLICVLALVLWWTVTYCCPYNLNNQSVCLKPKLRFCDVVILFFVLKAYKGLASEI